jgi:hypothetical protein
MFGSKLTISVELYETMGGKLLSSIVFESKDIDGLLAAIRSEAKPLFQSILGSRAPSLPALPPGQATSGGGIGVPRWIGIGLAAAGIGMGVYGFLQNCKHKSLGSDYGNATTADDAGAKWKKADDAKQRRNIGYIVGSALLAGGITVYFAF